MEKLLEVRWGPGQRTTYFIDRNKYSSAHMTDDGVILNAYEGTYHFSFSGRVTLDDGVRIREIKNVFWRVIEQGVR